MSAKPKFGSLQELFAEPSRWTRHAIAADSRGWVARANSVRAVCWCLLGATALVYPRSGDWREVIRKLTLAAGTDRLARWNDAEGRTHAEVLELVTKAGV